MIKTYRGIVLALVICAGLGAVLYFQSAQRRKAPFASKAAAETHGISPAAGPLFAQNIHYRLAIYMMPLPSIDPVRATQGWLAGHPDLKLIQEIPEQPEAPVLQVRIEKDIRGKFAPPNLEQLQYFAHGLSLQQQHALQRTQQVFVFDFAHPVSHVWTALREANELVEAVARKTGGLVWDEETREVFTPDAWEKKRLAEWKSGVPNINDQITIHLYKDGEAQRAITLGMAKVGLPDVAIESFPMFDDKQAVHLVEAFSQAIAEEGEMRKDGSFRLERTRIQNAGFRAEEVGNFKPNAKSLACLTVKPGPHRDGDPENRLLLLSADQYPGEDQTQKIETLLSSFFGATDEVNHIEHNAELLAESESEKNKLAALQNKFSAGLAPGEFLEVKAPFSTPSGGHEWMWVEVHRWKGDQITGILDNDPEDVPNMRAGQTVTVRQGDVFDYIHHYPDKHNEGNTTGAIIEQLEREKGHAKKDVVRLVDPPCEER